jgi:hypothetical protein
MDLPSPPPDPGARLPWRRRFPLALLVALLIYLGLAATTARSVGVVGETAIGWGLGRSPAVFVSLEPPLWADGATAPTAADRKGPLVRSLVRPIERLELGDLRLALAINSYTGGPPDWPAQAVWLLTHSVRAVTVLHVLLGALLLALVHRFVRIHGSDIGAGIAALVLATDWSFLFYKKVLGGTEVLLQAAVLLCLWALWSRRWAGGRHGLTALGVGVGIGLLAKSTFGITLVALGLAALLTRWDRPSLRPPLPSGLWKPVLAVVALTSPLWVTALHHGLGPEPAVQLASHDTSALQWRRVLNALSFERAPTREGLGNISAWAGDPLGFLRDAYGAEGGGWTPWRAVGWVLVGVGALASWRDRHPTPRIALHRFCTVFLVLQVGLLLLVARDLHHLAQAAPTLAIVVGLSVETLAGLRTPVRSPARAGLALLFALPWMGTGAATLAHTDAVVQSIPVPTFTEAGQRELVDMLRRNEVRTLVAADYELYGVLELLAPDIRVEHAWGVVAREGRAATPQLLRHAADGHLLVVRASAPMVYNLRADAKRLQAAAAEAQVVLDPVDRLSDDRAVLYRVSAAPEPD